MIVTEVSLYHVRYEMRRALSYASAKGIESLDSTIVALRTENGLCGWGEVCPFGRTYQHTSAESIRAVLRVLLAVIPGCDATNIGAAVRLMHSVVAGEGYAKSAIESALWDLVGRYSNLPVGALLGGIHAQRIPVPGGVFAKMVPSEMVSAMRELRGQGYLYFSPKLSGTVSENLACLRALLDDLEGEEYLLVDANGSWTRADALRIANLLTGAPAYLEQPCRTYQECLEVSRRTDVPLVLDEIMTGPNELRQALADGAIDGLKLKISRVGGLTQARKMTDLCAESGVGVWVQEAAGGELSQAAAGHLAVSVAPSVLKGAVDLQPFNARALSEGGPTMEQGYLVVPRTPGLGVTPDQGRLGAPVATYGLSGRSRDLG